MFVAAAGFGIVISLARVAFCTHFFSDTVVSFFVMLIISDFMGRSLFLPPPQPVPCTSAHPLAAKAMRYWPDRAYHTLRFDRR